MWRQSNSAASLTLSFFYTRLLPLVTPGCPPRASWVSFWYERRKASEKKHCFSDAFLLFFPSFTIDCYPLPPHAAPAGFLGACRYKRRKTLEKPHCFSDDFIVLYLIATPCHPLAAPAGFLGALSVQKKECSFDTKK